MARVFKSSSGYRQLIFWILAFGYILVYFHRLCPAVVAVDMMRDFAVSGGLVGLLSSAYFYPYAVMQLPAGLLSDSWGPRKTITVFFLLACAGSLILGRAPTVGWAILGRAMVGLGVSMLFVPTMKVLAEWFETKEFAGMAGILVAMGGVGSVTAATPLAWMSKAVGWRSSFLIVGGFTALMAVLVWLFVRDKPQDMGWESPAGHMDSGEPSIGLWEGVKRVLSYPSFWPMALWFFFGCAVFFSFIGLWGGPYLMHVYGFDKTQAGNILTMSAFGMIVGSPLLSFLSNRVFKGRKPLLVISGFSTMILTALLAFKTEGIPEWGLYALCFFMGIFANAIVAIGFTATKELFPVRIAGTSTGLVNLFPFMGGAIFQPILGQILEKSRAYPDGPFQVEGYRSAFLVLFLCGIMAFLSSLQMKETLGRD